MAFEFKFPDVGEGITEGELLSWKVKEGDVVAEDQTLAEVETDKAVVEMPSPRAGRVARLHAEEGETIEVGQVIVTIDDVGSAAQVPPSATAQTRCLFSESAMLPGNNDPIWPSSPIPSTIKSNLGTCPSFKPNVSLSVFS